MAVVAPLYSSPVHDRHRPVFFAAFFTDFFAAFLAGTFLTAFFAGVFLGVFFVIAFFVTVLAGDFFAAFVAGSFFATPVTVVAAAPIAVLMAPATSDAISIPIPTTSPALSTIVLSAIVRSLSPHVHMPLQIVEAYRNKARKSFASPSDLLPSRYLAGMPRALAANSFHPLRCAAEWPLKSHVAAALHPAIWHSPHSSQLRPLYTAFPGLSAGIMYSVPPFGFNYLSPGPPLLATPFITAATGFNNGQRIIF